MKKAISFSLVLAAIGFASVAGAAECGTLEVSYFDGQYNFVLNQGTFAIEATASNGGLASELTQFNGKQVCLQIEGGRDAYGAPRDVITGFSPQ